MDKDTVFESTLLRYRGIREDDAEKIVTWRNTDGVLQWMGNTQSFSIADHLLWFNNQYKDDDTRYDFMVFHKEIGEPIGTVGVKGLDKIHASCEISYMIGEENARCRGYGREAVGAMMRFAAQNGITLFIARIHPQNIASIKTVEKLGFEYNREEEGFAVYCKEV